MNSSSVPIDRADPSSKKSYPIKNMDPVRIIARLDIKGPDVVKGVQLEGVRRVGKPSELARKYYSQGADEIIFIDSVASLYGRNNILSVVRETARDVFVPITVGGGLRTIEDIKETLRAGADKVVINTASTQRPEFLREAAETFGSQCIVLSVQAMRRDNGQWEAYTDNARESAGRDVLEWVIEGQEMGVGEILVTSVNQEGSKKGFDIQLLEEIHRRVSVPIIASGGAGSPKHVAEIIEKGCADAVACASIFHYGICPLTDLKKFLIDARLAVRS
ncbi:imidazole glycerol phosphate synthase cyclase subunit [Nitrospinaceae bacterium]|jgi:imidazole glycerol-phosphate synthase subunit HisF|nr:imidazole glycerol phosphate synthase cyclase subunit [Nitrospinaceae bacterium]